jgi:hypothetical protein
MFLTPQAAFGGGPLRFAITLNGGGGEQQINGPSLTSGQWYHVAITLTGSSGTMYVDGVPVATNNSMTLAPSDLGVTTQNYLGDSQYGNDPPLFGNIDDFRIYAEALSAEQIADIAAAAAAAVQLTTPAPLVSTSSTEVQDSAFALLADDEAEAEEVSSSESISPVTTDDALLLLLIADTPSTSTSDDDSAPLETPFNSDDAEDPAAEFAGQFELNDTEELL